MKKIFTVLLILSLISASCKPGNKKLPEQSKNSVKQFELSELWRTDTVLMTPESVVYDKKRDIFYISDMNLEPRKKDNNGFISRMNKEGKITDLKWIEGLSSPKGMAIIADTLFAADVDEVVVMDITSGKIIRKIPIAGSKMLNDIAAGSDGVLYISDTDANKIYKYSKGTISDWFTEGLNGPNGLLTDGERILVASQGGMDFSEIDFKTMTRKLLTAGINRGDGIAYTGIPGFYLVSDWTGEIFMINPDNSKVSLLNTKPLKSNTADIEYLTDEKLLLVPTFSRNCIVAYKLMSK